MPSEDQSLHTERARALVRAITRLCTELDDLLLNPPDDEPPLAQPFIGRRIRITRGTHYGKCGKVTALRGSPENDFYYITLDDGTETYKKTRNFILLD